MLLLLLLQLSLDPVQTSQLIAKEEVQSSFSIFLQVSMVKEIERKKDSTFGLLYPRWKTVQVRG